MVSVGVKYILSIYVESSLPAIQELACQSYDPQDWNL